ncbi:MAG: rhomboid family intramembrane serine protease [Lachnospiraceae bacterium]|nr:rhomboid family intramembrane serine protease [Lachnospiraceae bacterium]
MEERNSFQYRKCIVTLVLVVINVLVYLCCIYAEKIPYGETTLADMIYDAGSMNTERILSNGEYYRSITSMFLHGGISHIVSNMIFLIALGEMLERVIGHSKFVLLYFLSGIGGDIFSMINVVLSRNYYTAIGASGAIFGLIGAMLVLVVLNDGHYEGISIKRMVLAIVYMVYSGMQSEGINNAAHLGGLVFGVLIMAAMYLMETIRWKRQG